MFNQSNNVEKSMRAQCNAHSHVESCIILGGGFDLETGILETHFFEANYLLRDKRQASSIIYSFGEVRDKNLSISCLDPETCTKCVPNHAMS